MVRAAALALALAGCYAPSPPSGGYRCDPSAGDDACPSNLQCICGTCVSGPEAAACGLHVEVDDAQNAPVCPQLPGILCVTEDRPFQVTITALLADSTTTSAYSGAVELDATWGHAHAAPFQLANGRATVMVSLDRATPPNTSVVVTARAGDAYSESVQSLFVDPAPLAVDPAPALDAKTGWARATVGYPAVDHPAGAGYTMFFTGVKQGANTLNASIGRARSDDGVTWAVDPEPVVPSQGQFYFSPSALHVADGDLRMFLSRAAGGGAPVTTIQLRSGDGGASFTPVGQELPPSLCSFCDERFGMLDPWVILDPKSRSTWLMFFSLTPKDTNNMMAPPVTTSFGRGRSLDGGMSWQLDPVPTPGSGEALNINLAFAPRVVYDARAGLYRMYYAQARFLPHVNANNQDEFAQLPCGSQIQYATSADGEFWTAARNPAGRTAALLPFQIDPPDAGDVTWATSANPFQANAPYLGLEPGAIEAPDPERGIDHYSLWFTAVALRTFPAVPNCDPLEPICDRCKPNEGCDPLHCCTAIECVPFAVGRATRM